MTIKTFSKLVVLLAAVFVGYTYLFSTSISQIEADITTGLVGHWKMDETSWNGTAGEVLDSSGSGNHGTGAGGATTTTSGKIGDTGVFDGGNDYFSVADDSSLQFGTGDFSAGAWVYPETMVYGPSDQGTIISKNFTGFELYTYQGRFSAYLGGTANALGGPTNMSTNKWYHVMLTRISGNVKLYVDGEVVSSKTNFADVGNIGTGIRIGDRVSGDAFFLDGNIDDARIYSRGLSTGDVTELYELGQQASCDSSSSSWYGAAWSNRKCFVVPSAQVDGNLTDFPTYLDLSNYGSDFFTNVNAGGSDIVITSSDGTTKLSRELVGISKVGNTGELWFKAPSLSSTTDNIFYIYYGNSVASESNDTSVWNSNYKMVQHMNEDPSNSSPQVQDSTSNNNDGSSVGSMTSGDLVSAQMGSGLDFDGSDDTISLGTDVLLQSNNFTVSAWVNLDTSNTGNIQHIFGARGRRWGLGENGGNIYFTFYDGSMRMAQTTATTSSWVHVVGVKRSTGTGVELYIDGSSAGTNSDTSNVLYASGDTGIGGDTAYGSRFMNGQVDEVRFYNGTLSVNWISTEYNNQSSPSSFVYVSSIAESLLVAQASCPASVQSRFQIGSTGLHQIGTFAVSTLNDTGTPFQWSVVMNQDVLQIFGGGVTLTKPDTSTISLTSANGVDVGITQTGVYTIVGKATNGDTCDTASITVVADPAAGLVIPPSGGGATTVSGGTDITTTPDLGTEDVYIRDGDGDIVAKIEIDLNTGRDWGAMKVIEDPVLSLSGVGKAAILHYPGGASNIPGNVNSDFTLYVPREGLDNYVRICPGVSTAEELSRNCAGGTNLKASVSGAQVTGQYTVTAATLEARDLWEIAGVTGTGGLGIQEGRVVYIDLDAQPATLPSTISTAPEVAVSTADEFYLSYIPTSTEFGIGDAVDIVIPFDWTGLATCATSTTDADGDATGDGALAVIDSQIIRFTFTAVTTTSLSTGVEFCFAATSSPTVGNYSIAMSDTNDGDFAPALIYVGDDNDVTISATIPITLSLRIKEELTTADTNACNLGVLNPGSVNNCSYRIAAGTNISTGLQVFVSADNQLNTAGDVADIDDTAGGGTITAGTEEHGILLDLGTSWTVGGSFSESTDEPMPLTSTLILDAAAAISDSSEVFWNKITHSASVNSGTAGGSYDQLVTYRAWVDT